MGIIILKPQKHDPYVTLNSQGRLFFSVGAIEELELTPEKGVLLAQDDEGNFLLKVVERDTRKTFTVFKYNRASPTMCIYVSNLVRRLGITVKRGTRYPLIGSEEGFYLIKGLKSLR